MTAGDWSPAGCLWTRQALGFSGALVPDMRWLDRAEVKIFWSQFVCYSYIGGITLTAVLLISRKLNFCQVGNWNLILGIPSWIQIHIITPAPQ